MSLVEVALNCNSPKWDTTTLLVLTPLPSTTIDQESTKLRLGLQATHTCDDSNNICYPDLEHSVIEVRLKSQYLSSGLFTNSEHGPIS